MQPLKEWSIDCPYCGERIGLLIDPSLDYQQYVEDCQVCCQPIVLSVYVTDGLVTDVQAGREND